MDIKWERDYRYEDKVFFTIEKFNGYSYLVEIWIEDSTKNQRFWVAVSSGKKRNSLDIFEEKNSKSHGGLKALFWAKKAIYDFIEFYGILKPTTVCVSWSDNRRRDIYMRLLKDFEIKMINNRKILAWKVKK